MSNLRVIVIVLGALMILAGAVLADIGHWYFTAFTLGALGFGTIMTGFCEEDL